MQAISDLIDLLDELIRKNGSGFSVLGSKVDKIGIKVNPTPYTGQDQNVAMARIR